MIVKKIKNKKLLLQVLDTTRVIKNDNDKYFLIFELILSRSIKINRVKKIGIVFEEEL